MTSDTTSELLPWHARVLTIFPDMFPGPLGVSLVGTALENEIWQLDCVDIRNFGLTKHRTVDDSPAGGGAGMVMRADVLAAAIDDARDGMAGVPLIFLSPRGQPLTQARVRELSAGPGALTSNSCGPTLRVSPDHVNATSSS
jgi:tRNA (guanine37-N1)-methyltransferase